MNVMRLLFFVIVLLNGFQVLNGQDIKKNGKEYTIPEGMIQKIEKTDAEWRAELGEEQFRILRQCSTEPPFTGKFVHHKAQGTYTCAGCGQELFDSETKYDSGSGWPSFFAAIGKDKITEIVDTSFGMVRTEIKCSRCNGHLGHVFTDGPKQGGLRYCVNSGALGFVEKTKK